MKRTFPRNGPDSSTALEPTEKIFEAEDSAVVQVGTDYILYGLEGKAGAREADKVFFKDLERIVVIRSKRLGSIRAIRYKANGSSGDFEIGDFESSDMEEIAGLLEQRAGRFLAQPVTQKYASTDWVVLLVIGLAAVVATACCVAFMYYWWTTQEQSGDLGSLGVLLILAGLLSLAVTLVAWAGFRRNLRT